MKTQHAKPIEILLVEDNPGDVRLTRESLREAKVRNNMVVAGDGLEALACLRREGQYTKANRPDLILLDLNLPRMNGFEVLDVIKEDPDLKRIPVVVLTTSQAEQDIIRSYNLYANAYVTKPVDLEQFIKVIRAIEGFWLEIVQLPDEKGPSEARRPSELLKSHNQQATKPYDAASRTRRPSRGPRSRTTTAPAPQRCQPLRRSRRWPRSRSPRRGARPCPARGCAG